MGPNSLNFPTSFKFESNLFSLNQICLSLNIIQTLEVYIFRRKKKFSSLKGIWIKLKICWYFWKVIGEKINGYPSFEHASLKLFWSQSKGLKHAKFKGLKLKAERILANLGARRVKIAEFGKLKIRFVWGNFKGRELTFTF